MFLKGVELTIVIGLHGKKGSGKDTFYRVLKESSEYSDRISKVAFADPIKEQVNNIFTLPCENAYDLFKRSYIDLPTHRIYGRHIVREIGMLMRSYNPHQFCKYVQQKVSENPDRIWVVTDVRFENEWEMLKDYYQSPIVHINRHSTEIDNHISEKPCEESVIDYVIDNNGSFGEFEENTLRVFEDILGRTKFI